MIETKKYKKLDVIDLNGYKYIFLKKEENCYCYGCAFENTQNIYEDNMCKSILYGLGLQSCDKSNTLLVPLGDKINMTNEEITQYLKSFKLKYFKNPHKPNPKRKVINECSECPLKIFGEACEIIRRVHFGFEDCDFNAVEYKK